MTGTLAIAIAQAATKLSVVVLDGLEEAIARKERKANILGAGRARGATPAAVTWGEGVSLGQHLRAEGPLAAGWLAAALLLRIREGGPFPWVAVRGRIALHVHLREVVTRRS